MNDNNFGMKRNSLLRGEKIRLRAVEPEDVQLMFAVENDDSEWLNSDNIAPFSREQLMQYALTYDSDPLRSGQLRLIIESIETSQAVGIVDLYEISSIHAHGYIGIYIIPSFRGRGYARESIEKICEYAHRRLRLRHLAARIISLNEASVKLFTRCGFVKAGELKDWAIIDNDPATVLIFQKRL